MNAINETAEERCKQFNVETASKYRLRSQLQRHPRFAFHGDPDRIVDCLKNCLVTVKSSRLTMLMAVRRLFRSVTLLMRWIHRYIAAKRVKVLAIVEHWEAEEFLRRRALDAEMSSPNYRLRKGISEAMEASQEVNVPRAVKVEVASIIVKRHTQTRWRLRAAWATRLYAIEKELVESKAIAHAKIFGASVSAAASARIDWGKIRSLRLQYMETAQECPQSTDCTSPSWGALHAVRQEILDKRIRMGRDVTLQTYAEKKEEERRRRVEIFNAAEKKRMEEYRQAQRQLTKKAPIDKLEETRNDFERTGSRSGGDPSPNGSPMMGAKRTSSASPEGALSRSIRRRRSSVSIIGALSNTVTLNKVDEADLVGERSWSSPSPTRVSVGGASMPSSALSPSNLRTQSIHIDEGLAGAPFGGYTTRPSTGNAETIPEAPSCIAMDSPKSHVTQRSRTNIRITLRRDLSTVSGASVIPSRDVGESIISVNPLSYKLSPIFRSRSSCEARTLDPISPAAIGHRRSSTPGLTFFNEPTVQGLKAQRYVEEKQEAQRVLEKRRNTTIGFTINVNRTPPKSLPAIHRTPNQSPGSQSLSNGSTTSPSNANRRASVSVLDRSKRAPIEQMMHGSFGRSPSPIAIGEGISPLRR